MKGHLNLVDAVALTRAMTYFGIFSSQTVTDAQGRKLATVSLSHDSQTLHIEAQDDLLGLTDQSTPRKD